MGTPGFGKGRKILELHLIPTIGTCATVLCFPFDLNQLTINLHQLLGVDVCEAMVRPLFCFGERDKSLVLFDTVIDGLGLAEGASQ